jgi:hypothetical protein
MFCLNQFNFFIKKTNFEFGYWCVCNEKKFIHELDMWYSKSSFKFEIYEKFTHNES